MQQRLPMSLMTWEQLERTVRSWFDTIHRCLIQIGCALRPGSIRGADLALCSFATFLAEQYPDITTIAAASRTHIEDYKAWLASVPAAQPAG
jgi:hypothetical protein